MYNCSKCGKDIEAPKDLTVRAVRCQCGNMVSFSDALTMVPQPVSNHENSKKDVNKVKAFEDAVNKKVNSLSNFLFASDAGNVPEAFPQSPTPTHADAIIVPGYRIIRKIGEGGMGRVFEAVQESLGRSVAIKILPEKLASDPQFVKRFDREAGTLSQLRHPNIGGIIDRGSVSGTYYFVMEYVADKNGNIVTLQDLINQRKLDGNSVLKFTREIAAALAYAHSKGVIHRDIKPSNILIDEHSAARVVDFGIAQILGDEQTKRLHLTMTGESIGTPQYMSPEQRTNATKADARSDIYSLGVMVYEMLTGGFPEGAWDLPSELGCDPKWNSIIENSIRKLPERRVQTMTDFLSSLDVFGTAPLLPKEVTASSSKVKEERYRTPVPSSILGKCPACGVENHGDNKFCNGCGASLYEACPVCQGDIRVGLKFCGKCGVDVLKQKKINELKESISKVLIEAFAKKDDIVAATEILLAAIKLEESFVNISGTGSIQPLPVHVALNSLWDEKSLSSEIFPSSGIRHIEFLNRVFIQLPDRKDIQSKIWELSSERDNLLEELRNLFKDGHFLTLMQMVSKSRWGEYLEIASIVADAEKRFRKASHFVDSQIPVLINARRYYELNKVLAELEGLGADVEGLSELRKETDLTLCKAKRMHEAAIKFNYTNKQPETARLALGKLISMCSDYPEAYDLLDKVNIEISEYMKIIDEAKVHIACKEYRKAVDHLEPLSSRYDFDEVKILYEYAVKGAERIFRRNLIISGIALLSVISIIVITLAVNRHFNYNAYCNAAFESGKALSNNDFENALKFSEEALKISGYENDETTIRKRDYAKWMIEGKLSFDKKNWVNAEKAFKNALSIPGYEKSREASGSLKKCSDYFEYNNNKNKDVFNNAVSEGAKALFGNDFEKALKFSEEALKIPGYESNEAAIRQRDFVKLMIEGKTAIDKKYWVNAEKAFKVALSIPGYEKNSIAATCLKSAQDGLEIERKQKSLVDIQKQKEEARRKAVESEGRCADLRRKAEAVKASSNASILWNGAVMLDSEAKKRHSEGDFAKSAELWEKAAAEFGKAETFTKSAIEIEKKRNDAETAFTAASARVTKVLPVIKDSSSAYAKRIKACEDGVEALSDVSNLSYLSDSSKSERSNLLTQISTLKSSLKPPWAEAGKNWKISDIGMEFVWIKELDCWVGKYEVTNGEYRMFKSDHDSKDYKGDSLNGDRQPVVFMNFDNATQYAKWLTEREQKAGRLPPGYRYRLPTEWEWTTFCQCGDNREYPWGNSIPPKYGNYHGQEGAGSYDKISGYNDGSPVSCPVEKSGKNDWGLYGVGGNVWECTVTTSSVLSFASWRGGAWSVSLPRLLRYTCRVYYFNSGSEYECGFRLVLSR